MLQLPLQKHLSKSRYSLESTIYMERNGSAFLDSGRCAKVNTRSPAKTETVPMFSAYNCTLIFFKFISRGRETLIHIPSPSFSLLCNFTTTRQSVFATKVNCQIDTVKEMENYNCTNSSSIFLAKENFSAFAYLLIYLNIICFLQVILK